MQNQELNVGGVKVEINPASAPVAVPKPTQNVFEVTDARGRVITLKRPSPLANLDFAEAAGSEKINVLYLAEIAHLKFVAAIDGNVVPTPSTKGELRALYQRLDDDGNEAAITGVHKYFTSGNAEDTTLKNS